ncbi:MAG: sigma-54-dependent Fis family transcriptional regulator [Verrucomicrobiales bacterium]|nr:sigma-54-dependent Fis family transcriptional regulator [Verrucomicrobiales bacterium]
MANIVIIDDEAPILELMGQLVRKMGHKPYLYQTGREGVDALEKIRADLLIVDLRIGDMNGLQIIQDCRMRHPKTEVVMVTGYGSVETAVEAMKLGAFDYLTKPFELDDLQRSINRAVQKDTIPLPSTQAAEPAVRMVVPTRIIGESSQIKEILRMAEKIADNDSPCLLEGEFGSGKQMVARTVHNISRRSAAPFKVLHCSSLPEELLELELFGSSSGGTHTIFNRAQGGTVVLEEINVLPPRLQSQMDAFLEDIANRRLTGSLPKNLDFRFIATSSIPLERLVAENKFREDLYYRISVIPITIPPLRSRKDDIPLLTEHFLKNYAKLSGTPVKEIDKYAMDLLMGYSWPGNVGELQNALERACAFAEKNRIRPADLPPKITQKVEISDDENEKLKHQLPIGTKLGDFIKKQEKLFIRETLKFNDGSREKTATMLGVSIATLYRKMGLKLERDKILR